MWSVDQECPLLETPRLILCTIFSFSLNLETAYANVDRDAIPKERTKVAEK